MSNKIDYLTIANEIKDVLQKHNISLYDSEDVLKRIEKMFSCACIRELKQKSIKDVCLQIEWDEL